MIIHFLAGMAATYLAGMLHMHFAWLVLAWWLVYLAERDVRRRETRGELYNYAISHWYPARDVVDTETCDWFNLIIKKVYREYAEHTWSPSVAEWLASSLDYYKPEVSEAIEVSDFILGDAAPKIRAVKMYKSRRNEDIQADLDMEWLSKCAFTITILMKRKALRLRVPIRVSDISLCATVRIHILLDKENPGMRTISAAFTSKPSVDGDLRPLKSSVNVMEMPILSGWVKNELFDQLLRWYILPLCYTWTIREEDMPMSARQAQDEEISVHGVPDDADAVSMRAARAPPRSPPVSGAASGTPTTAMSNSLDVETASIRTARSPPDGVSLKSTVEAGVAGRGPTSFVSNVRGSVSFFSRRRTEVPATPPNNATIAAASAAMAMASSAHSPSASPKLAAAPLFELSEVPEMPQQQQQQQQTSDADLLMASPRPRSLSVSTRTSVTSIASQLGPAELEEYRAIAGKDAVLAQIRNMGSKRQSRVLGNSGSVQEVPDQVLVDVATRAIDAANGVPTDPASIAGERQASWDDLAFPSLSTLQVMVLEAKDLPTSLGHGRSDALCQVTYGKVEMRTQVAVRTNNPQWYCPLRFPADDRSVRELQFEVLDAHKAGKPRKLASAVLQIDDTVFAGLPCVRWIPLNAAKHRRRERSAPARLCVEVSYVHGESPMTLASTSHVPMRSGASSDSRSQASASGQTMSMSRSLPALRSRPQ